MANELITNALQGAGEGAAEQITQGFFERIFALYNQFISIFPEQYQWIVSIIIILAVASFLWNLIRKNWLWVILLVVIFPGALPVLKNIFDSLAKLFIGK